MQYDLLVGADGAGSVIRSELQKVMPPGFLSRRAHDAVYATGPLEIKNKEDFPKHTFTTMDSFHVSPPFTQGSKCLHKILSTQKQTLELLQAFAYVVQLAIISRARVERLDSAALTLMVRPCVTLGQ